MTAISQKANQIFDALIEEYHIEDSIQQEYENPFEEGTIEHLLYLKCWTDTIQWHVEDLIRDPQIDPQKGMLYKRQIDQLNQKRTNTVERIDDYYLVIFENVEVQPPATINTESPAWAIDRLSILALKIYHMHQETEREDIESEQKKQCEQKLAILLEQRSDLSIAIDELLTDIQQGRKLMKVYRQMKMYNDPRLNPVLYAKSSKQNG